MGRRLKVAIGIGLALLVLLGVNALVVSGETRSAEVTVPGGRILGLPEGEIQVVERGRPGTQPIVLIHCFTCAIDWWDELAPRLAREHRVIAVDLLGHGGSAKPGSSYSMAAQADLVAAAMERLGAEQGVVVGHSLGGTVATALLERHPELVERLAIIGQAPDESYGHDLPFPANLSFVPVIGQAAWQLMPDSSVEDGLAAAFVPGADVPEAFIADLRRMTYTSYDQSASAEGDYSGAIPLDRRIAAARAPLLAIFGAEERIYYPERSLAAYRRIPGAETRLIAGAGHSPNVERPRLTANLILRFAREGPEGIGSSVRDVTERGSAPQRSSKRRP